MVNKQKKKTSHQDASARNQKMQTRAARRAEQEELIRQRSLQAAKERKQQTIIGVVVVAVLVIIALFVGNIIVRNIFFKDQISYETEKNAYAALQKVKVKPARVDDKGGILFSNLGYGKKHDNVPTVAVYMDPHCPGCGDFNRQTDGMLAKMMEAGQVNLDFHPMSFLDRGSSDHYSRRVAAAMLYIADHDNNPRHLINFISHVFAADFQPKEGPAYVPVPDKVIEKAMVDSGVSQAVADKALGNEFYPWLEASDSYTSSRHSLWNVQGELKGTMSTPTITINDHFIDTVELRKLQMSYPQAILHSIGLDAAHIGDSHAMPKINSHEAPIPLNKK